MYAPPVADPSAPSAPPAGTFDNVPGYEGTMVGGGEFWGQDYSESQYVHV